MNPAPASAVPPGVTPETLAETRTNVRNLLSQSAAFRALPPDRQQEIAKHTVEVASFLAQPHEGVVNATPLSADPYALPLADAPGTSPAPSRSRGGGGGRGQREFTAEGAREGAEVAGALLEAVDFPAFVSGLVSGVFHAIVESSIDQMEAYGRLVADVAKSLNDFRDENVSVNQGRDHLIEKFPDVFFVDVDTGDDWGNGPPSPRVRMREGVDEQAALRRVNELPVEGGPVTSLDDDTVEDRLVPAARTQLATSRQQLLATMVMMGINRIVVTDGKISAKVMYDFKARDKFSKTSATTEMDYDQRMTRNTQTGSYESEDHGGESTYNRAADGAVERTRSSGGSYAKGEYRNTQEPILKLVSATNTSQDATLDTKASLAGVVDINFKSDYFPLEKMADSFQIARIQNAAEPGKGKPAPAAIGAGNSAPAPATGTPAPAAGTPAPATGGGTPAP